MDEPVEEKEIPITGLPPPPKPCTYIGDYATWALQQLEDILNPMELKQLKKNLAGPVRMGSLCSGMDVGAMASNAIYEAAKVLGIQKPGCVQHQWCCEIDARKREVLRSAHGFVQMFTDIHDMGKNKKAFCELANAPVEPAPVDILTFGFVCKSISAMNADPKAFRDKSSLTGGTYAAGLQVIKKLQPPLVVLENVGRLADKRGLDSKTPADEVVRDMSKLGYTSHYLVLDARNFALPQRRKRVYVLCILRSALSSRTTSPQLRYPAIVRALQTAPPNIKAYLSKDVESEAPAKRQKSDDLGTKWKGYHEDYTLTHSIPKKTVQDMKRHFKGSQDFQSLTDREKEALVLRLSVEVADGNQGWLKKNGDVVVAQVDQNVHRMPIATHLCPCLTEHSKMFLTGSPSGPRLLTGEEALRMQGIGPQEFSRYSLGEASASLARNLAGNSFAGTCSVAALLAGMSLTNI